MKNPFFWIAGLGLTLAAVPLIGQPDAASSNAPAATLSDTNLPAEFVGTNSPEAIEQRLENAPGQLVSGPAQPRNVRLTAAAAEIARMGQAGVGDNVLLSYVTNSPGTFNLSADDIIYLSDIGVADDVVAAMVQHDQSLKQKAPAAAAAPPIYTNPGAEQQTAPAAEEPGAPVAYDTPAESVPPEVQTIDTSSGDVNNAYTYFYDALAPYGSWINIGGYGMCWQPSAVLINPGWQPYRDRGRWLYSDHGWYWVSDYTWGWAPFHYGRWFRHYRWGWCWAPDTVWGPSWVTWRYSGEYCGWAPLPPTACYTPGIGFTYYGYPVGFSFGFGLSWNYYTFVPFSHVHHRHWHRHRCDDHHVRGFFHSTRPANRIVYHERRLINDGVPVGRVAAASGSTIRAVRIRDASDPATARLERTTSGRDRTIPVYRPVLPKPTRETRLVGQAVQPAPRPIRDVPRLTEGSRGATPGTPIAEIGGPNRRNRATPVPVHQNLITERAKPADPSTVGRVDPAGNAPTTVARPETATRPTRQVNPPRRSEPLILRGPDRTPTTRESPAPAAPRYSAETLNAARNATAPAPAQPAVRPSHNAVSGAQPPSRPQFSIPQRSMPMPATQPTAPTPAQRSAPSINRQAPVYVPRSVETPRSYAPVQSQPAVRSFEAPRAPNPSPRYSPPAMPERSAPPVIHSTPRIEQHSPPPAVRSAPQVEHRSAPVTPRSSPSHGDGGSSRGDFRRGR